MITLLIINTVIDYLASPSHFVYHYMYNKIDIMPWITTMMTLFCLFKIILLLQTKIKFMYENSGL